jgi:outer membrane protein assembly factor BamE (lipoprotein component of BamABCDE complex)
MSLRYAPTVLLALALAAPLVGGCTKVRDHQGYVIDRELAAGIQPGVDNRDSVERTLGRPTFTGQFNQNEWYYVSRQTRQLAFQHSRPSDQTVLRVRFDEAGNVTAVENTGLELVQRIDPSGETTPTLGRNRSWFEEIFGNIGATAPASAARLPTTRNKRFLPIEDGEGDHARHGGGVKGAGRRCARDPPIQSLLLLHHPSGGPPSPSELGEEPSGRCRQPPARRA